MKRGIILPAVLVLISLLVLLAFTRSWFSRQQLHQADMISEREQAYHVADGMRTIGVAMVKQAFGFINSGSSQTWPKPEKSGKTLRPIVSKFCDDNGLLEAKPFLLELESETIDEFADKLEKSNVRVAERSLTLQFLPLHPLLNPANSHKGVQPDPREVRWKIVLKSFARVGAGVETLVWYREGKTVSLQPDLFGKFTLFIHEPEPDALNLIDAQNKNQPLVLNHGEVSAAGQLEPRSARDLIDRQGWVFLGESSVCKFRNGSGTALVNSGYFENDLDSDELISKKGSFKYYYYCDHFRPELQKSGDGIAPFALCPEQEFARTSSLLLHGTAASPSPTIIIGRATRSNPVVQGLAGQKSGLTFPFPMLDESGFSENDWPCRLRNNEIDMIRGNFKNKFENYARRMSFIFEEPVNAANLQALNLGKIHREFAILQPEALPADVPRPPTLKRLQVNQNPAEFIGFVSGSAYSILNEGGTEIFTNAALNSLRNVSYLKSKAVRKFKNLEECSASLEKNLKGEIILPGIIFIEDDTILKQSFRIAENGGALLFAGNLKVATDLIANNGRLLSLISLSGNISVSSSLRVDAALVAADGEVRIGAGSQINGCVAAKFFKHEISEKAVQINYHRAFDPTSTDERMKSYRLCMDEEEYFLVE